MRNLLIYIPILTASVLSLYQIKNNGDGVVRITRNCSKLLEVGSCRGVPPWAPPDTATRGAHGRTPLRISVSGAQWTDKRSKGWKESHTLFGVLCAQLSVKAGAETSWRRNMWI